MACVVADRCGGQATTGSAYQGHLERDALGAAITSLAAASTGADPADRAELMAKGAAAAQQVCGSCSCCCGRCGVAVVMHWTTGQSPEVPVSEEGQFAELHLPHPPITLHIPRPALDHSPMMCSSQVLTCKGAVVLEGIDSIKMSDVLVTRSE
jgi:hypothetical protein